MNILVTLDGGYLKPLCVMLRSLLHYHPQTYFNIYVMNRSLTEENFNFVKENVTNKNYSLIDIKISDDNLADAPITNRYPQEMYFRIFAAKFLPCNLDKVLYLDPDLVVLNSLDALYNIDLKDYFFAAATHISKPLEVINRVRLKMPKNAKYINSGVMLLNLPILRQHQNYVDVYKYIEQRKKMLILPDQDIISTVYAGKILLFSTYKYNMSERLLYAPKTIMKKINYKWVAQNTSIVHYCGRNKPWKKVYFGRMDCFFNKFAYDLYTNDK